MNGFGCSVTHKAAVKTIREYSCWCLGVRESVHDPQLSFFGVNDTCSTEKHRESERAQNQHLKKEGIEQIQ